MYQKTRDRGRLVEADRSRPISASRYFSAV